VVQRAIAPVPEERPRSAGAVMSELMEAMPAVARQGADGAALPGPDQPWDVVTPPPAADRQDGRTTPRRLPVVATAALAVTAAFAVVLLLGFLTTTHYDYALGRSGDFAGEGVASWLVFSFRALFPLVIYATVVLLIFRVFGALWHFTQRLSPPVRRLSSHARSSISGTFGRIAGSDGASISQGLLLAQMLSFGVVVWAYWRLILVFPIKVNDADAVSLAVLSDADSNTLLLTYAPVMSVLLCVGALGWIWLRRNPLLWVTVPVSGVATAIALMAVMVLLIVVPDRLLFKSVVPEVLFQQKRCFVTGSSQDQSLLFCPGEPKGHRTRAVKTSELQPQGRTASIFSPAADAPK
jgi:hypothetical protein